MSPFRCASLLVMWLALATTGSTGEEEGVPVFYARKMMTYFRHVDRDKDNFLTEKDYKIIAGSISKRQKLSEEKDKELKEKKVPKVWEIFENDLYKTGKPVNEKEFIESMAMRKKEPDFLQSLITLKKGVFEVLDVDADGVLDLEEYRALPIALGMDPDETEASSKAYDSDQNGSISSDEYFSVTAEYFTNEEDELKPSSRIFGTLVS